MTGTGSRDARKHQPGKLAPAERIRLFESLSPGTLKAMADAEADD